MRKTLHIVVALVTLLWAWGVSGVLAQSETGRPFITKWRGEKGKELKIPIVGTYKMVIKDESGNEKVNITVIVRNTYECYIFTPMEDGIYTVEAGPEGVRYMRTRTDDGDSIGEPSSLREVVQFGTVKWGLMEKMFSQCKNMTFAEGIDTPDLSRVTNMREMFYGCSSFNQPLNEWDVSNVTNMKRMFFGCRSFNQPLDNWDVSNVTNMEWMFSDCSAFNQPLDNWDVSKVTNMKGMFDNCSAFNQPLDNWNVSNVTDMHWMFSGCSAFKQPLGNWNVSNVTDMGSMFSGCAAFKQPLGNWNVSNVTDMHWMFEGCSSFNQPLNNWNVSNVTNMDGMFYGCSAFNQPLANWNVSKVTEMSSMFNGCSAFNQPLDNWNVSNVTSMEYMFRGCSAFNQPLDNWNVSEVTNMGRMFEGCSAFNQPLGSWKIKTAVEGLSTTAMSPSNYSTTLVGWAGQTKFTGNLEFKENVKDLIYNDEGKEARQELIDKGWKFDGDRYQASGIAITPHSLPLVLNREFTLPLDKWGVVETTEEVTLSTDKGEIISYEWTADKKGVHIKGLKAGTCKLTATIAAKPGVHGVYTSTCEINVYIPIELITISPASKTLKVGEEFTFTAHIFPENATKREVRWGCTYSEIATVNNGKVTASKAGICNVYTVTNVYGSWFFGRCLVTVVDKSTPVTHLLLPEKRTLQVGTTTQLVAAVLPDNAEQGLVWKSSDPEIATVSEGFVWGKKKGECTITVKSLDPTCSITKQCKITVEVPSFAVTLTQPTNGKIAIEGHGTETTLTVEQGTTLTVTVTPDEGCKLKELKAGDEDITNTKQFTVKAATEVKAVFEKETFVVTTSVNNEAWGSIELAGASDLTAVPYGTELTVTVTENEGYKLKSLKAGDKDIMATKKFIVKAATEVKAVFEKETFKVNEKIVGTGALNFTDGLGQPLDPAAVPYGTTVKVVPVENTPWELVSLMIGNEDITTSRSFVLKSEVTVYAVFQNKTVPTFRVTVTQTAGGTIAILGYTKAALEKVSKDTELTVTVTPDTEHGYKLKELKVGDEDITAIKKFTVKADTEVKAVFELLTFQITPEVTGEGCSLTFKNAATDAPITDLGAVPYGTTVKVVPVENDPWKLKSLSANGKDIFAAKEFTIKEATTVKAVFKKPLPTFKVTLSLAAHGKIAIEGHGTETSITVAQGTTLTVTVTPDEGYKLKSLKAGDEDITNTKQFTVKAATEVKAVFEKETFAVKMSVNDEKGGEIVLSGATDLKAVEYGTELTVTVTEKEGYKLKSLKASDKDIMATKKFIVKAATEVKAVFEKKTFAVTINVNDEKWGSIELVGASNLTAVAYGTELTVKVTEKEGYELKELKANDEDIIATKKFIVKATTEVKAVFESKQGGAVEDALLAGIAVAPNPFSAQLRILNPEGVVARYELVNASGIIVHSGVLSEKELVVNTEALPSGIYFVRVAAQNGARRV